MFLQDDLAAVDRAGRRLGDSVVPYSNRGSNRRAADREPRTMTGETQMHPSMLGA
jgi:hypothetical protein